MDKATIDAETISMEELRKLAEVEARKQSTPSTILGGVAGGSTPTEEEEVEEVVTPTPKTFSAERSIDLGDGAGIQVFKGKGTSREDALESLSDSLAEAQRNATRKIRELNAKAKEPVKAVVDPNKESLLAAKIISAPSEVIDEILRSKGIDIEELKQATAYTKGQKLALEKKTAADAFVTNHPDFADTQRNGKLINKWCELHNDFSLDGLTKAYQDLNESGLLDVKGEEAGDGQGKEKPVTRIEPTVEDTPSQRTKKASGLSTHRKTVVPTNAVLSEDDMYGLSLEELRKRANQQLTGSH